MCAGCPCTSSGLESGSVARLSRRPTRGPSLPIGLCEFSARVTRAHASTSRRVLGLADSVQPCNLTPPMLASLVRKCQCFNLLRFARWSSEAPRPKVRRAVQLGILIRWRSSMTLELVHRPWSLVSPALAAVTLIADQGLAVRVQAGAILNSPQMHGCSGSW